MRQSTLAFQQDDSAPQTPLFEDCAVMPMQYFANERRSTLPGERRLLLAVLEEAIECFCKTCGATDAHSRRLHREAEDWIFGEDRSWWLSFTNVCDVLDIDTEYLRGPLAAWKREQLKKRPPHRSRRLSVPLLATA